METKLELRIEVEPYTPNTEGPVTTEFSTAVAETFAEADLRTTLAGEPEQAFEQPLPVDAHTIELIMAGLTFLLKEGPEAWRGVKNLFGRIAGRVSKAQMNRISGKITRGNRTIEFKNLPPSVADEFVAQAVQALTSPTHHA